MTAGGYNLLQKKEKPSSGTLRKRAFFGPEENFGQTVRSCPIFLFFTSLPGGKENWWGRCGFANFLLPGRCVANYRAWSQGSACFLGDITQIVRKWDKTPLFDTKRLPIREPFKWSGLRQITNHELRITVFQNRIGTMISSSTGRIFSVYASMYSSRVGMRPSRAQRAATWDEPR